MKNLMLEKKKIIINIALAMGIGSLLLIVAVLPAEYGIDPTGAGKLMGFDRLHVAEETSKLDKTVIEKKEVKEVKKYPALKLENLGSPSSVEKPKEIDNAAPANPSEFRSDEFTIDVLAGKGIEFKVKMKKYDQFKYEWVTNEGVVFHDFHGEVKQGEKYSKFYESYAQAFSNNVVGTFLAPFEGIHGWYFSNKSDKDVQVKLRLKGQYAI